MNYIGKFGENWYVVEQDDMTSKQTRYGPFPSKEGAEAHAEEWEMEVA